MLYTTQISFAWANKHSASESEVEKPHGKKPLTIRKEKEKDTLGKATCDCPPAASVIDP